MTTDNIKITFSSKNKSTEVIIRTSYLSNNDASLIWLFVEILPLLTHLKDVIMTFSSHLQTTYVLKKIAS